jgi:hypothetical protein
MILNELARGEKEVLSLVVAVRRALDRAGNIKGGLLGRIESTLRRLVASGAVVDHDGRYSLSPPK